MKTLSLALLLIVANVAAAQTPDSTPANAPAVPTLKIDAAQTTGMVSPMLYGLMTEEINYSYEGGLYGELIRNRTLKANASEPQFWTAVGGAAISLDKTRPLNPALDVSLRVDASKASEGSPSGIANAGYWGIPVRPDTTYRASFYARGDELPLALSLQSADGKTVFAGTSVPKISGEWKQYEVALKTGSDMQPSKDNLFVITTTKPGTAWFQQVSLFPPTYNDRPNGTRPDIMQLLGAMQPKFLRFPGGNYVEGSYIKERFNWKETIGDISQRPGHRSPWNYWSTDGMGLLEFLDWCEDVHMQPLLAVFAGYALKHDYVKPGPDLTPYVQDALDEIEYVTGDATTKWGAQRGKDGHPAPFPLTYVEVGNEDFADHSGSYDGRFAQFYDAIKAKYPKLQLIATAKVALRIPDLLDEHFYFNSEDDAEARAAVSYDQYSRASKTKIFVGEWATRVGNPTNNMAGALGDAAWMTGLERNSDVVVMQCYAPLFANVSDLKPHVGSMQWGTDLIGYDALNSYGSPSYYAQVMFSTHHGDEILATDSQDIPTRNSQPRARRDGTLPPVQQITKLFFNATRDSQSGTVYLKVVNSLDTAQPVNIEIRGAAAIKPQGKAIVLKANKLSDTNTIREPTKIVPAEEEAGGLGASFTREFPPYSITVLELNTK
jgi:alpha-N-arabinofuranosidase